MELVFEPDLASGEEAASLVKELILIMERLGTCDCKMEGMLAIFLATTNIDWIFFRGFHACRRQCVRSEGWCQ
jgi:hypothetical protein